MFDLNDLQLLSKSTLPYYPVGRSEGMLACRFHLLKNQVFANFSKNLSRYLDILPS